MTVFDFAYALIAILERRFERGYFIRCASGQAVWQLPELMEAIERGEWP